MLPMKFRSVRSRSSVACWIRRSPLPFSSPIESRATRGVATPSTCSLKIAPIRAYWARFSGLESGLAPMSRRTSVPPSATSWTARAGRSTPGSRPSLQDRGGHARAGVAGRDDRVGLAALHQLGRDEDRAVLLLAQGEGGLVLVHVRRPRRRGRSRRSEGSSPARPRIVASSPTRITRSCGFARAWSRAPGTTSAGPWSPPIASTAMRDPAAVIGRRAGGRCGRPVVGGDHLSPRCRSRSA